MNILDNNPYEELRDEEFYRLVLDFCTFVCLVKNKKMNFPSIFVEILRDNDILDVYVKYCGCEDKREAILEFMKIDETIIRSKYVKKYINQNGNNQQG